MSLRARWLLASVLCSVLLAGLTAWRVTDWVLHRHGLSHAEHGHVEPDFHAWMHEHLDITPEQHAALEPVEGRFEQERARLKAEIRAAGLELAEAIRREAAVEGRTGVSALPSGEAVPEGRTGVSALPSGAAVPEGRTGVSALPLEEALDRLTRRQAELQRLTLEHFFAMKRQLRPAQAARLLEWTHDSLTREP